MKDFMTFGAWGVGRLGRVQSYPIGASSNRCVVVLTLALTLASCKNSKLVLPEYRTTAGAWFPV